MRKFYIITGTMPMATTAFRKLNFRLNEDGSIRGMYFSSNPKAIPGGTIYFKSKRKAKKYLYLCYGYPYDNPVVTESKLTSRDLFKVKRGLYLSKNTNFYKTYLR